MPTNEEHIHVWDHCVDRVFPRVAVNMSSMIFYIYDKIYELLFHLVQFGCYLFNPCPPY